MRFHKDTDCYQLLKYPARGSKGELVTYDIADVPAAKPCKICWPDYPSREVVHSWCRICQPGGKIYPCKHNGGVEILRLQPYLDRRSYVIPYGEERVVRRYVWPDSVVLYT